MMAPMMDWSGFYIGVEGGGDFFGSDKTLFSRLRFRQPAASTRPAASLVAS